MNSRAHKRTKFSIDANGQQIPCFISYICSEPEAKNGEYPANVVDFRNPFAFTDLLCEMDSGKYGSATKDIEELLVQRRQCLAQLVEKYPLLPQALYSSEINEGKGTQKASGLAGRLGDQNIINLDDDGVENDAPAAAQPVLILDDSDEEDLKNWKPSYPFQEIFLANSAVSAGQLPVGDMGVKDYKKMSRRGGLLNAETLTNKDKGVYVGVQEEDDYEPDVVDDGLGDIWNEMTVALECAKDGTEDASSDGNVSEDMESCDHSFVLKDDIGYVCRVCGVVDRKIETIFEFQYIKGKRTTRTYMSESRNAKGRDSPGSVGFEVQDLVVTEVSAHPRHMKQMKPHQVEGFNFLVSNLVTDHPGGCILAHAPGSGKTFMIISFIQSFLGKYPNARPLVVLPKGILATWKKEFQRWQVEDIPLLDFYTKKAENRAQQLEVLKLWVEQKSILFLGYKQFSTIICDTETSKQSVSCQEILLKAPSLLILDEGHTPRNEDTDVLQSLAKVQTPRKVVLSGTLYQNHVKEVFNILNLVRPKFLKLDASRIAIKRIMSRVHIPGFKKQFKAGAEVAFYDLVEHTLQKDTDFKRKVAVIQDLREMTKQVLHYYKGDFLDELPGLVDFTLVLNLSSKQRHEVEKLKRVTRKFKISAVGSAVYLHPELNVFSDITDSWPKKKGSNEGKMDEHSVMKKMDQIVEKLDVKQGVKTKFFLNILKLCESAGEKLLVFSQYLIPLKFLERLAMKAKSWALGREIFFISGASSAEEREWSMERFNNSADAKIFFGSVKACGEGISLVGASRVLILDVHLNPSVTRQAIGRAFRPGQSKKVYVYRLVAADSPEEEDHNTCFKKEIISKMWFEWNEFCGFRDFDVETADVKECGDPFLENPIVNQDVRVLYKR